VMILVAEFDGPQGQNNRVTETILSQLKDATEGYSDVKVEALEKAITEQAGSEAARKLGKQRKATIMIWGWYGKTDDTVPISVNFEVLQPPEYLPEFGETASGAVQAFALSELNSFKLQTRLSSEMSYLTLFTLGVAEYAAEDWTAAVTLFDDALTQTDESPESLDLSITHFYKGNSLSFNEDFEAAIAAYDAALKIKPDGHGVLYNKGITLAELGRYEEAITTYDAALKIKLDDHEVLNNKGTALGNLGRYEAAIAACDASLKLQLDDPGSYFDIARCYALANQPQPSLDNLEKLLKLAPEAGREEIKSSDDFKSLRDQPRFKALMGTN
jgi:tetratricopeptide (TPR) repeat protein